MAKGAHLTKQVKILIAQIHLGHLDWGATKIRESLLQELKSLGLDQNFGPDWPSVSAVQKELTEIRTTLKERPPGLKELDNLWSLGALVKYPIPPEALPMVLRVCAQREAMPLSVRVYNERHRQDVKAGPLSNREPFSIRDALWVSRLSELFADPQDIWLFAAMYSSRERAYEAIGEPTDTVYTDKRLLRELGLEQSKESEGGTP